jgi:soluble calcium-activated nucleotidase 1
VGTATPERGFSTVKFVPGTNETVVAALKSEENEKEGTENSFMTVIDLERREVLMEEVPVPGNMKYEGLEFVLSPDGLHDKN